MVNADVFHGLVLLHFLHCIDIATANTTNLSPSTRMYGPGAVHRQLAL